MNKPVAILGVLVAVGAVVGASRWLATEPAPLPSAMPAALAPVPAGRPAPAAAPQPAVPRDETDEVPAANATALKRDSDARSPFGHASGQGDVEAQLSTSPEYPESDAEAGSDGTGLAPALAETRAMLADLLAEAGAEGAAEAEVLVDARAALEGLLEDPDPAVREQVAGLLEVLGGAVPQ